jgi:hypothetical protein
VLTCLPVFTGITQRDVVKKRDREVDEKRWVRHPAELFAHQHQRSSCTADCLGSGSCDGHRVSIDLHSQHACCVAGVCDAFGFHEYKEITVKSQVQEEYTAVEYDIKLEKASGLCILAIETAGCFNDLSIAACRQMGCLHTPPHLHAHMQPTSAAFHR